MSGGRPGGCHGSSGGGGALSEILAERRGKGWSGRVLSVDALRGELGCKPCSANGFAGIRGRSVGPNVVEAAYVFFQRIGLV